MFSYNRVQLVGYQTQPIDVRQTPSGTSVTDLNLAVPYSFQSENGETLTGKGFHTITLWGPMADIAGQYARAGSQLFVSGRLQTDSWEDEQSGEKRSKTKIVGLAMILLDPKDGQQPAIAGAPDVGVNVNRADVIGHITRDPELRTTTNGQQVLTLGVATNDRWKDKQSGEDRERSEFHNVVVWGKLADQIQRTLKKGNRVFCSGRVQTRSWETPNGAKRYTTEIVAETVSLLGTEHPTVKDNIEHTGQPVSKAAPATEQANAKAHSREAEAVAAAVSSVPKVQYESEVKPEDLPF